MQSIISHGTPCLTHGYCHLIPPPHHQHHAEILKNQLCSMKREKIFRENNFRGHLHRRQGGGQPPELHPCVPGPLKGLCHEIFRPNLVSIERSREVRKTRSERWENFSPFPQARIKPFTLSSEWEENFLCITERNVLRARGEQREISLALLKHVRWALSTEWNMIFSTCAARKFSCTHSKKIFSCAHHSLRG